MIADDMRVIFRAEPHERIVSVVNYRDRVLIATQGRILEWNPDNETVSVLEFVIIDPPDERAMVCAYHKARTFGA